REILANLGVPFVVRAADVDESTRAGEDAPAYLARIVDAKLAAVRAPADPAVIESGAILGKPASFEESEAMIARLAGRTHEVHTRFAIRAGEALHAETVVTHVTFRVL